MLCDDILADTDLPAFYRGFEPTRKLLRGAHKYTLAADFAAAADGMVNNLPELNRISPFCRLPFQTCWFELAQADRPHFQEAPLHFTELQSRPKRVGFLCHAPDPATPWRWLTTLAWSLTVTKFGSGPNNVSVIQVSFDTKDGSDLEGAVTQIHMAPFTPYESHMLMTLHEPKFVQLLQSDWGGEIRYVLAVLGLLNARNVAETELVDKSRTNAKRCRTGARELCSHTVLKIRAAHRKSFQRPGRPPATAEEIRLHFVSGHWKARSTGLFWWGAHMRGNPTRGAVLHDHREVAL